MDAVVEYILRKIRGRFRKHSPHGGGDLFTPGSDPETTFLEWFATQ